MEVQDKRHHETSENILHPKLTQLIKKLNNFPSSEEACKIVEMRNVKK
jgi:hypothetical protein